MLDFLFSANGGMLRTQLVEAVVDRVDALGWLTVKRIGRQLPRALQPAAISNDDSWAMEQETMLDL